MNRITSSVVPIAFILIGSLVMTNRPRPMHRSDYTAASEKELQGSLRIGCERDLGATG